MIMFNKNRIVAALLALALSVSVFAGAVPGPKEGELIRRRDNRDHFSCFHFASLRPLQIIFYGGKEYRRVVAAFERIFGATIFLGSDTSDGCNRVVERAQFNFMQQARIWYEGGAGEDNVVVLSEEFYAGFSRILFLAI